MKTRTLDRMPPHALEEIARLKAENAKLREFRDYCRYLTGSLWPQNETTQQLAALLGESDGE